MKNLIEKLTEVSKGFKALYLEKTKEFAINEFNELREWCANYKEGVYGFSGASKKYWRLPAYIVNSNGNAEMHIEKSLKDANAKFESNLLKLAFRIKDKGLDITNITIFNASVGTNFNCSITDGVKTINAYTILAWGMIQKPHYRYLIK